MARAMRSLARPGSRRSKNVRDTRDRQREHHPGGHRRHQRDPPPGVGAGDQGEHPERGGGQGDHRRGAVGNQGAAGGQPGDEVGGERGRRAGDAGRDGKPQHTRNESRCDPLCTRRERQHERGHADGQRGDQRQVPGEEREAQALQALVGGQRHHRGRDGKQHGVDGLGEEQARHPLDVAEHPPALRHHVREGGEAVVQQHDLGGGTGGPAARSHRHAQVRAGEREHVVDAVAGHRHRVAAGLERGHEDLLLAGADPPEHRVALQRVGHGRQFRLRQLGPARFPALAPGGQGAGVRPGDRRRRSPAAWRWRPPTPRCPPRSP